MFRYAQVLALALVALAACASRVARSDAIERARIVGYQPSVEVLSTRRIRLTFANAGDRVLCIPNMYLHPDGELHRSGIHIYNDAGDEWQDSTLEVRGPSGTTRLLPGERRVATYGIAESYKPPASGDSISRVRWVGLAYSC